MEVPGLNSGKFFAHLFYPAVNTLLEYLNPMMLHLLGFCFITLLL